MESKSVPLDPAVPVEEINKSGMPLLGGHDPGFPTGRVLGAATFKSPDGERSWQQCSDITTEST